MDYVAHGKRYVRSTKTPDKYLATRILRDIEGRIAGGRFDLADYNKKTTTLSRFFEEYFNVVEGQKKPNTIINERNYARKFLAFVGDADLRSLDPRIMDQWKARTLASVSPTTYNIERRTLQAMFGKAIDWGFSDENPFKRLRKVRVDEHRFWMTGQELSLVFNAIDQELENAHSARDREFLKRFRMLLEFLLWTGLRREEALGLSPENVDLERGIISLERTKSKLLRIVPLNRRAVEVLRQVTPDLFRRLGKNHVSRKFAYYLEKAGLSGFKLHSLRHTFAVNLISAGIDVLTVSRLLGHADIRTTMIYAKVRMDVLRDAVEKLETSHSNGKELVKVTVGEVADFAKSACAWRDLNPQPSDPKSDALSS